MKCDLCLYRDAVTEPVRLREHGYRWSQKTYRLCATCKKHSHGGFKYINPRMARQINKKPLESEDKRG